VCAQLATRKALSSARAVNQCASRECASRESASRATLQLQLSLSLSEPSLSLSEPPLKLSSLLSSARAVNQCAFVSVGASLRS
jgi:hypothetical protein